MYSNYSNTYDVTEICSNTQYSRALNADITYKYKFRFLCFVEDQASK